MAITICPKCVRLLHYKGEVLEDSIGTSDERISKIRENYIKKFPESMQKDKDIFFRWCPRCYAEIKRK